LIDIYGDGFQLTDVLNGVLFDLLGSGKPKQICWTVPYSDDGWLFLDRNGNGVVDNGLELFGNYTEQPFSLEEQNGFRALAVFDQNHDGVIDSADPVYKDLRIWRDANHNGISEPAELFTLPQLDVLSIDLDYKKLKKTDQYGNWLGMRAKVRTTHGIVFAADVTLCQ